MRGNGLPDVPELDDPILLVEAENVDDRYVLDSRPQPHSRMYRDEVAFGDRSLNLKRLIGIFCRVPLHPLG